MAVGELNRKQLRLAKQEFSGKSILFWNPVIKGTIELDVVMFGAGQFLRSGAQ